MEKQGKVLIAEALKVYKIPEKYVFASREDPETGEAVIVTHGGKKIRHKKGEPAQFELAETEITGALPDQDFVWSKKYNQKIDLREIFNKYKEKFKKWGGWK